MNSSFARFCLLCFLPLCLLCACKMVRQRGADTKNMSELISHLQGSGPGGVPGLAPDGSRMGTPYVSALGETCYEVYPQNSPGGQMQALCRRNGSWTLLPSIYAGAPQPQAVAFSREQQPYQAPVSAKRSAQAKRPAASSSSR